MKEAKKEQKGPRPNMKNKVFVSWSKAETCKQEDNIVSTEWHEKLKKLEPFCPVYDNQPVNMVYLLSGEYGRLWQKERDEWYKNVFVPRPDQRDFEERKKKIRKQARAAKKAAEASTKERQIRRAKEIEAKAREKAEELEKVRERVRKLAAPKLPAKAPKKKKGVKEGEEDEKKEKEKEKEAEAEGKKEATCSRPSATEANEDKGETVPKGLKPAEPGLKCECSDHVNDKPKEEREEKVEQEPETSRSETSNQGCIMCDEYAQQLQEVQNGKCLSNEGLETSGGQGEVPVE